jgi:hypothetical protein
MLCQHLYIRKPCHLLNMFLASQKVNKIINRRQGKANHFNVLNICYRTVSSTVYQDTDQSNGYEMIRVLDTEMIRVMDTEMIRVLDTEMITVMDTEMIRVLDTEMCVQRWPVLPS